MAATNSNNNKIILAALVILALLIVFFTISYNGFVKKEEAVFKSFNNLQSDYQRRLELIPNLVSVVKGSTDFEKETLLKLVEARAKAAKINITGNITADEYNKAEQVQAAVAVNANSLIAVIEKYPDLKSEKSFIRLQDQLEGTERRIKFSRKDFNESVADYNQQVRSFPKNIAAKIFGFKMKEGFKAEGGAENAPEIDFNAK